MLTVNLVPSTYEALERAAEIAGDNRTDSVNRALQLYLHIVESARAGHGRVSFNLSDGGARVVVDINRPWWRFW